MLLEARGLILLNHDEAERAFDDLSSAVAINASAWQAYNGLGLIANKRGDHSAAIAHYDMALGINPDAGPVLNNRGYAKMLAYDYIGARTDLSRAARDLGYRQAWINLGALYAKLELYDQAVDAYGEVRCLRLIFRKRKRTCWRSRRRWVVTRLLREQSDAASQRVLRGYITTFLTGSE
jgi:Tfp pilus assembly protein PilF